MKVNVISYLSFLVLVLSFVSCFERKMPVKLIIENRSNYLKFNGKDSIHSGKNNNPYIVIRKLGEVSKIFNSLNNKKKIVHLFPVAKKYGYLKFTFVDINNEITFYGDLVFYGDDLGRLFKISNYYTRNDELVLYILNNYFTNTIPLDAINK